jgi:hypothetical protein
MHGWSRPVACLLRAASSSYGLAVANYIGQLARLYCILFMPYRSVRALMIDDVDRTVYLGTVLN